VIKVQRICNLTDLENVKNDWEDLLIRSGNKSIFMTWEWLITWWEVYGGDYELWWLVIRDQGDKLIGSAPLYLRKQRNGLFFPHRELRFVGTGAPVAPEHLDVIIDSKEKEETLQAISNYLALHSSDWDVLYFSDISDPNAAAYLLSKSLSKGGAVVVVDQQVPLAPYVPLPNSWEEYFKSLGKWLRRTIARQRNKQTRELDMSFHIWSPENGELSSAFDKFEALYASRKETMAVENKFEKASGYRQFHRLLAKRFSEKGWFHLAFLKIGDQEVAAEYTFKYLDTLYSYQCGFDAAYGKNNVFKVLRSYVIENAIQQGIKEFDLLRGEEPYKYDWGAITREKKMIRCFSSTSYGRILNSVLGLKRMTKKMLQIKVMTQ